MQVRNAIMQTAKPLFNTAAGMTARPNNFFGWGMVDALKAVQGTTSSGNTGNGVIPTQFVLRNNYPNPFNGSTTIIVDAPGEQSIELAIYDLLGRRVRTIFKGTSTKGSTYHQWRGALNDNGIQVTTGVYLCRLTTPGSVSSQKILYIK
jgi:hypothetical protein